MTASNGPRVPAILLAAGASRRLGGDFQKVLLPVGGIPLVRRVAEAAAASSADRVIAVVGFQAGDVREALACLPSLEIVVNDAWHEGRAGSVRVGLRSLLPEDAGAIFLPGDLPFLSTSLIDRVLAAFRSDPDRVTFPTANGDKRNPTVFPRRLFDRLASLSGDESGLGIIRSEWERATLVPLAEEDFAFPAGDLTALDVDTREDYARARILAGDAVVGDSAVRGNP